MLRLLVLAALLAAPMAAFAQPAFPTDTGAYRLGGSVGINSQSTAGGERVTTFRLHPSGGLFVLPGLFVGGSLQASHTISDGFSATTLGVGPEVGYYFGASDRTLYPFVAASTSYQRNWFDGSASNTLYARLSGGLTLMVARNVGLTANAYYSTTVYDFELNDRGDAFSTDAFGIEGGVSLFIF